MDHTRTGREPPQQASGETSMVAARREWVSDGAVALGDDTRDVDLQDA